MKAAEEEPGGMGEVVDGMLARGVRAHLVRYSQHLQNALEQNVPDRVLIENGIPAVDIVLARAGMGELPPGTSGQIGAGVFTCDEHDRRVVLVVNNGRLLHFAGDPSWCEPGPGAGHV